MEQVMPRLCGIVYGAVEMADGGGDGAYDLHDIVGTPEEIGAAITKSLQETSLMRGQTDVLEEGGELYLVVKIKFCDPAKAGERTNAQMTEEAPAPEIAPALDASKTDADGVPVLDAKAYIAGGAGTCPFCTSNDLQGDQNGAEVDGLTATHEVTCGACGTQWYESFTMDGVFQTDRQKEYTNVHGPDCHCTRCQPGVE
jgi:hypothetical protein